jgi:hypothetical protein
LLLFIVFILCKPVRLFTVDCHIKVHMDLQIPRRSQGTLHPLSVRTQGIESVEQCATQGFNLVKKGKLSFEEPSCI